MSIQRDFLIKAVLNFATVQENKKEIIVLRETFINLQPYQLYELQHLMKYEFDLTINKK